MTGIVKQLWAETENSWGFGLEDAPAVSFGFAGKLSPDWASVVELVRSKGRIVTISLRATTTRHNPNGVTFRGSWGAPQATTGNPAEYGHDGHGHINDLPAELVAAILAECGNLTLPTSPDNHIDDTPAPAAAPRQD